MNYKHHTCCGKKKRYRVADGKLVEQPHKCSDASDVTGVDWKAVQEKQK